MDRTAEVLGRVRRLLRRAVTRISRSPLMLLVLLAVSGPACSEQRRPASTGSVRQGRAPTPTTRPTPSDDYVSRAVLEMAAEDQQRSAQSLDREPPVRYRDSPMRSPRR